MTTSYEHFDGDVLNPTLYNASSLEVLYYQGRIQWPWRRGWIHAMGMALLVGGLIVIFSILYLRDIRIDNSRLNLAAKNRRKRQNGLPQRALPERSTADRISTHLRSLAYLRCKWFASFSVGIGCLCLIGYLYPVLYTFAQHPYYQWEPFLGPPGLAGRAGMCALGLMPFVLAMGMKSNPVAWLTGVGHEKLNVLHRWMGMLMFILSLTHALPFIIEPLQNGGREALEEKFRATHTYWNGVGALACLFWLCFASLPPFRTFCYEGFVHIHIFAGMGFLGLLFWHANNQLVSWAYLYVTCGVWVLGLVYRLIFRTSFFRAFHGEHAHFTSLTDRGVKISVPTTLRWKAGQHVFIRIPGISMLDNHPFTIASMPERAPGEHNDLVLVFKPREGFTKRVASIAKNNPDNSYRCFLDGPYGGLSRKLEAFETVLLIAGGSGITPVMSHLRCLAHLMKTRQAVTRDVRVIWTVKHFDILEWFKDEISVIARSMPRNTLLVQYFVTQETPVALPPGPVSATRDWPTSPMSPAFPRSMPFAPPPPLPNRNSRIISEEEYELSVLAMRKELGHPAPPPPAHTADSCFPPIPPSAPPTTTNSPVSEADTIDYEKGFSQQSYAAQSYSDFKNIGVAVDERCIGTERLPPLGDEVMLEFGRPPLKDGLRQWSDGFGRRACVYVCGPEQMKVDVSNAVATMQPDIWASEDREEVYLHTETFGW